MLGETAIQFGTSVLDLETGEMVRGADTSRLGRRTLKVVRALLDAQGRVVTNEDLLLQVWPGMVVEANTVQVHISLLRKALGPDRGCLRTLSGRGYRLQIPAQQQPFVAEVVEPRDDLHGNLPAQLDMIIGRDEDLRAAQTALFKNRLVSIVGSGGVGKTRLALEIGWQLHGQFAEGVWLIDFATVRDPELAVIAAASALGIRIHGESHTLSELTASLANSQRLLIFDNCEYQSRAIARLVEALLRGVPSVTILVTSQEPLGIQGEHLFPLAPLPAPLSTDTDSKQFAAVALFVKRAQEKDPGFVLNASSSPYVAEICRRLDGVPLAIEMAVGRLTLLGLKALAEGLDDRLQLLRATSLDTELRHATLLTMVEWSIGLLNADEEPFFFRLGIFPSSFSLDAAVAIAGAGDINRWQAFDLLGQLVNKSLLVVVQDDPPRYRLLETLRLFALEKLAQRSEYDKVAERLALWVIEYFANAHSDWELFSDKEWHRRYSVEVENVRAALAWGFADSKRSSLTAELASGTARVWRRSAWGQEGQSYISRALALTQQTPHTIARAELLVQKAEFLKVDSPASALRHVEESIAILRHHDDQINLARTLSLAVYLSSRLGDAERAAKNFAEAETALTRHDLTKSLANLFSNYATFAAYELRFDDAREYFGKSLAQSRRIGDEVREGFALLNLAEVEFQDHDIDAAISLARDSLRKLDSSDETVGRCNTLTNLAGYLLACNRIHDAATALEESMLLWRFESRMPTTYRATALARCAQLSALTGNNAAAATLIGYLDPFFQVNVEIVQEMHELNLFNKISAAVRDSLTEQDFERFRRRGALYSAEEVDHLASEQVIVPALALHESHTQPENQMATQRSARLIDQQL